jgi:hypothetical protein
MTQRQSEILLMRNVAKLRNMSQSSNVKSENLGKTPENDLNRNIKMADHVAVVEGKNSGLVLSDATYDTLRQVVEKLLPAAGAFYALLAGFWGFPHPVEVVGSLAGLAVFLGVALSLARRGYVPPVELKDAHYDGEVIADVVDGQAALRLELNEAATQNLVNKPNLLIKGLTTD